MEHLKLNMFKTVKLNMFKTGGNNKSFWDISNSSFITLHPWRARKDKMKESPMLEAQAILVPEGRKERQTNQLLEVRVKLPVALLKTSYYLMLHLC